MVVLGGDGPGIGAAPACGIAEDEGLFPGDPGQLQHGIPVLRPELLFVHGVQIAVAQGVALDGHQPGVGHFLHLGPGQLVGLAQVVDDDEDRGLHVVLLQQGKELGVVVVVAVVEGQHHGLLDFIHPVQVLKGYGGVAPVQ